MKIKRTIQAGIAVNKIPLEVSLGFDLDDENEILDAII